MKKYLKQTLASSFIVLIITIVILISGVAVLGQNPHIPLIFSSFVVMIYGLLCGIEWKKLIRHIVSSISESIEVMIIICLIGVLVATLMASGAVPAVIFYGLKLLSPGVFLPFVLVICSVMSICTGSSWTTIGTIGIAFIGISHGLGIPLPITAGAILCGAYFGDKQSPVSDSTNFAAGVAKTGLYEHTKSMLYSTVPAQIIALIIFVVIGLFYRSKAIDYSQITVMQNGIYNNIKINVLLIFPIVFMMILIVRKIPAILTIILTIIVAGIIMIGVQSISVKDAFTIMYSGNVGTTGIEVVDKLLTRGGLTSMLSTIALMLISLMLAGLLQATSIIKVVLDSMRKHINSDFSLIFITLISTIILSFLASDPYLAMLIPANLFGLEFDNRGISRSVLSRTLEDGGTIICPMVPWGTNGLYCSATLGIPVLTYLPYYFLGFLDPIVAVINAKFGWGVIKNRVLKNS